MFLLTSFNSNSNSNFMLYFLLNYFCANCDASEFWQLSIQGSATPSTEGMLFFYNYLMLFIVLIGVFVFYIMYYIIVFFSKYSNSKVQKFTHYSFLEIILVSLFIVMFIFALFYQCCAYTYCEYIPADSCSILKGGSSKYIRVLETAGMLETAGIIESVNVINSLAMFKYTHTQLGVLIRKDYSIVPICDYIYIAFSLFFIRVRDCLGNIRQLIKLGFTTRPHSRLLELTLPNSLFYICLFAVPSGLGKFIESIILNVADYLHLSYNKGDCKCTEFLYVEFLEQIPKIIEKLVESVVGFLSPDSLTDFQNMINPERLDESGIESAYRYLSVPYFYDCLKKILLECFGIYLNVGDPSAGKMRYNRKGFDSIAFNQDLVEKIKKGNKNTPGVLLTGYLQYYNIRNSWLAKDLKWLPGVSVLSICSGKDGVNRVGLLNPSTASIGCNLKDTPKALKKSTLVKRGEGCESFIVISNRGSMSKNPYSIKTPTGASRVLNKDCEIPSSCVVQLRRKTGVSTLDFKLASRLLYFSKVSIRVFGTFPEEGGNLVLKIRDVLELYPLIPELVSDRRALLSEISPIYKECIAFEFGDSDDIDIE